MSNFGIFYDARSPKWPCHVTQEANFKKIFFLLILHLILGKLTKFVVQKLSTSEVISQNLKGGGKHPPVVLVLKLIRIKILPGKTLSTFFSVLVFIQVSSV